MKPQLGYRKRALVSKAGGAETLQEELIAAIHGAFEVAVEIAVQEVRKLVGQATGDVYEEMRQENESLKLRLQRAEDMLESARLDERGGSSPHTKQHLDATTYTDPPLLPQCNQNRQDPMVGDVHDFTGGQGEPRPVDYPPDPQRGCMSRNQEQTPGSGVETKHLSDAASHPEKMTGLGFAYDALTTKVNEELSHVCVMKIETLNQTYDYDSRPLPTHIDRTTLEQITVKQETREEERDGSASCLDLVKDDHFGSECMLQVQSKLLAEWKPQVLDIQSQDSNSPLPFTRLAKGHPPNLTTNLPSLTDLPSLSSEIPNIPEAPHKICGGNLRTSLNLSHPHACKYCGQTFQLPSLLRRHYSQCPQKCYQQPVSKSRRTKVQLYPPGCSPFRCTVCSREFNRMENLKTHLRIHTGERPYTCSVCSTCFRHSGALTRHFRIHTGEKPYICGVCGKSFRNCGGLKFHQRSHNKQLQ